MVHPVSEMFFNQWRLAVAISKLCKRVADHSHFLGAAQIVGTSIKVGIKIFSIVKGLGLVAGLCRGCGL